MRDCYVSSNLLKHCMKELPKDLIDLSSKSDQSASCGSFLCAKDGSCLTERKVTFKDGIRTH